jgi:DNA adenine methylase
MVNMKKKVPTFIKWAGGKTQLLPQFKELFPDKITTYIEPFLGSGAVFFYLKKNYKIKKAILSDINEELINCFKIVRDNPSDLIELLRQHKVLHSQNAKDYYYGIRKLNPKDLSEVQRAARLIYLNKTCFNGLYRVNSKGEFNVPIGDYKNPDIVSEDKIKEASELLKGSVIKTMSFTKIGRTAKCGDFIYFDPPYYPISKTANFTSYTQRSFAKKEQKQLSRLFIKLHKKGCFLMLSNSNSDFIVPLYNKPQFKFDIKFVDARRVINCDATKRGSIKEIVVRNY